MSFRIQWILLVVALTALAFFLIGAFVAVSGCVLLLAGDLAAARALGWVAVGAWTLFSAAFVATVFLAVFVQVATSAAPARLDNLFPFDAPPALPQEPTPNPQERSDV